MSIQAAEKKTFKQLIMTYLFTAIGAFLAAVAIAQ